MNTIWVDTSGSYLFLDKDAKPTWLIIRHTTELDAQVELLQGYDVPDQIIDSVSRKEKMLFLFSEKEYKKPTDEWFKHMYDSEKLDDNYYYSVVSGQLTDSIDWARVVSYSDYLDGKKVM